jgi:hypothetical protein
MEVFSVELDTVGLSIAIQRGRMSLHRALELWKLLVIVVLNETIVSIKTSVSSLDSSLDNASMKCL